MYLFAIATCKVATDTNILDLLTRYRTKLGWFFWFWPIQRFDTTMGKWQILYLRTRYRSKLGLLFWFGPIHVTIRRNLANEGRVSLAKPAFPPQGPVRRGGAVPRGAAHREDDPADGQGHLQASQDQGTVLSGYSNLRLQWHISYGFKLLQNLK